VSVGGAPEIEALSNEEGRKENAMLSIVRRYVLIAFLIFAIVAQSAGASLLPEEAIKLLADRLDQSQEKEGPNRGLWLPDVLFVGPTTAGMVCAYESTGDPNYLAAAELAGDYILWFADIQGNMLGDEVYAFVLLSEGSENPEDNLWRSALEAWFYSMRRPNYEESTREYIRYFEEMDVSTAVFYIAQQMIGAYYVDDVEKGVWREVLIEYLSHVDDQAVYPVMALGVATWALATTGPLDETPVTDYLSAPCWDGVVLSDLPGVLASHQVPEDEPFAGSFYWRLDHTAGETEGVVAGYTEDAIYGTLGLVAVASLAREAIDPNMVDPNAVDTVAEGDVAEHDFDGAIEAACEALLQGIDEEGVVFQHLSLVGQTRYAYAGEMLQALWHVEQYLEPGDDDNETLEVDVEPDASGESDVDK